MSFFFPGAKNKKLEPVSVDTLHQLRCKVCPLNSEQLCNGKMPPSGIDEASIYILGEAPYSDEDRLGEPFVGKSGQILKEALLGNLTKLYDNFPKLNKAVKGMFRFNNVISCHPPKNRDPSWQEIECCRQFKIEDIEKAKPTVIIGVGNIALKWMLDSTGIVGWRGRKVPVQIGSHKCWFYPVAHPAFLMRKRQSGYGGKVLKSEDEKVFERDILRIIKEHDKLPEPDVEDISKLYDGIITIDGSGGEKDLKLVKHYLDKFSQKKYSAFDLETNQLRPYANNSLILTFSVCDENESVAFALEHKQALWTREQKNKLYSYIESFLKSESRKIAHNLTFELEWMIHRYGKDIVPSPENYEDTMAQAYLIDTRKGTLNLEFLCQLYFGFKLKEFSDVSRKDLDKEELEKVLKYNALDSKYEYKLFMRQRIELRKLKVEDLYRDQIRRICTFTFSQIKGLLVDQNEVTRHRNRLEHELKILERKMRSLSCVKSFEETKDSIFNSRSPAQAGVIFKEILKCTQGYRGEGSYSTDEKVLVRIKEEYDEEQEEYKLANLLLEHRGLQKLISTYVYGISPGGEYLWPDGLIHTQIHANFTDTRRTSSSSPNSQNFPKRKNKEIRSQIKPHKGHKFLACDFKQLEVVIIGVASKDQRICQAIREQFDFHKYWAEVLATDNPRLVGGSSGLDDKQVMKDFRSSIKNTFVFPLFYGAGVKNVSQGVGLPHHVMDRYVTQFWDMFPDVKKWQEGLFKSYETQGFIRSLTGFYYRAPLDKTKLINYPIQGSASDITVNAMNRLSEEYRLTGKKQYQANLNIHDDLTFEIPVESLDEDIEHVLDIMLHPEFDWVTVPLTVEAELGNDWFNMKELGAFVS